MDYAELTKLHNMYNFSLQKEDANYLVYYQLIGYFKLAIIVKKRQDFDVAKIKEEYEDIGYSCIVKEYTSIDDAHQNLYTNYFKINDSKQRAQNEYNAFCDRQSKRLASQYRYINCGMLIDGSSYDKNGIATLCNIIEEHNNDPQLIIIEAAAGFGKTCTACEIFNRISKKDNNLVPIYIELSKNRTASIFRYILLDEIDRKFSFLNTEVVQEEIARGNVPLIVDGFDELINRSMSLIQGDSIDQDKPQFDEAESMLDTIAALLKNDAKIIITARKSSIFYGDKFEEWVNNHCDQFKVVRVVLDEPQIKDWLDAKKESLLVGNGIPLRDIANPVLLAYLMNQTYEELEKSFSEKQGVVEQYFHILLEREKSRQNINLQVEEQYTILSHLASSLMTLEISSCRKEDICDLIIMKDESMLAQIIDERYLAEKPSVNDLAMTLAGHALLDRMNFRTNNIGFVNDFVFGDLLASAICDDPQVEGVTPYYIMLSATAYSSRIEEKRIKLFAVLQKYLVLLNASERLYVDIMLQRRTTDNYINAVFSDICFQEPFDFSATYTFKYCQFQQCVFKNVIIRSDLFEDCTFIECKFSNCSFIDAEKHSISNSFYNCIGCDELQSFYNMVYEIEDSTINYRRLILEQYWPIGRPSTQTRCTYRTLICGFSANQYKQVDQAIEELKHDGFITKAGQYYYLSKEKIPEIKKMLGR